jgi:pilus assembly protein Flp/PilA
MDRIQTAQTLRGFLRDERGGTAIEYALIAVGIGVAIIGAAETLGARLVSLFYDKLIGAF